MNCPNQGRRIFCCIPVPCAFINDWFPSLWKGHEHSRRWIWQISTTLCQDISATSGGTAGRGDNEYHVVLWRTGNAQKVPCYLDFDTTAFRIARGPQDRTPEPINFIGQAHQGYPGPGQPRRPALGRLRPTISITGHNLYEIDAERSQRKCAREAARGGAA